MPQSSLDDEFAALRDCAELSDDAAQVECLRRFLNHRTNLVVERAATLVGERRFVELTADLCGAYQRLQTKPIKADPGCIAKTAVCAALRMLEYGDADFFRAGLTYTQFEPYFGGLEDKAGTLRAECILALVQLRAPGFLESAVDLMFDPIPTTRAGAIRAIANSARAEASLLLRMKALMGDESSEVVGEALSGLVQLADDGGLEFVGRFLNDANAEVVGEAAFALAESRRAEVVPLIVARWQKSPHGPMCSTLFTALALCRHDDALVALCDIAANQELEVSKRAITALQQSPDQQKVRETLVAKLEGCLQSERLRYFEEAFPR